MMFADLSDADIIFPLDREEIRTHANRQVLVDIAFWGRHDVRVFCFDPAAMVPLDWSHFLQCVFRWATYFGLRPISMIGAYTRRGGYDLGEEYQDWFLRPENAERVTALL